MVQTGSMVLQPSWGLFALGYSQFVASGFYGLCMGAWKKNLPPVPGGTLLDLSSGSGGPWLTYIGATGVRRIIGVDYCPEMQAEALRTAERLKKSGWKGKVRQINQSIADILPVEDKSVDIVTCNLGLYLSAEERATVFKEVNRVLKVGGYWLCLTQRQGFDFRKQMTLRWVIWSLLKGRNKLSLTTMSRNRPVNKTIQEQLDRGTISFPNVVEWFNLHYHNGFEICAYDEFWPFVILTCARKVASLD